MHVVLVIDTSYSMRTLSDGKKYMDYAKEAANNFVDLVMADNMPDSNRVSVVSFAGELGQKDVLSLGNKQDAKNQVTSYINSLTEAPGGGTFTQGGLHAAYEMLNQDRANTNDPDDQKFNRVIIVLSDGLPTRHYEVAAITDQPDYNFNYRHPLYDGGVSSERVLYPAVRFYYSSVIKTTEWFLAKYRDMYVVPGGLGDMSMISKLSPVSLDWRME